MKPDVLVPARFSPAGGEMSAWLPILAGLAVLFVPTWVECSRILWIYDENSHGPLILLVSLYYFWHRRREFAQPPSHDLPFTGSLIVAAGLITYLIGRSQQILDFELGSEIIILIGLILALKGTRALRHLWFPIFFMLFLLPIPGSIVELLTGPLKKYISLITEHILYAAGYPIARSGVELDIGYYQLLVANACSGINSMFSLTALGFLYMHVMQHTSIRRNTILLATILPVAFTSNVIRVIFLVLLTYYFGDAVGQSYLHQFAGLVMFTASILNHFMLDHLLGWPFPDQTDEVAGATS